MSIKTSDLRPCDNCGGPIAPVFFRVEVKLRQMAIDETAVNQVMGTALLFGGNMALGTLMSPNRDAAIELPGYQLDRDFIVCTSCYDMAIALSDLMAQAEEEE